MGSDIKISIRFFDDKEVRAVWDDEKSKWWFSVLDIVAVLTGHEDYNKVRNYWKYLKSKLKKEGNELGSVCLITTALLSSANNFPEQKQTGLLNGLHSATKA